ncbi:MAG TPA: ribosome-associated translation inhibitor RaiA [Candidatus Eisenbacteria bacterium]|jgi:putative sigma-54 modulation protein|nr:ribosome-associated translation inhibitor RaiA [Candidatus Eisenbacteria bacterium]
MEIDITGRHFHVTEALKDYAAEKMKKLDKYSLKLEHAHVVMEVQKFRHVTEITIRGKGIRLTAKNESLDMYAAFDKCFGNIQLQLRRQHDRVRDHKLRRAGAATKKLKAAKK